MIFQLNNYPLLHFIGSKETMWQWIVSNIRDHELSFETTLDMFGGSGFISQVFRNMMQKQVYYNDFLFFLTFINSALLQVSPQDQIFNIKELKTSIYSTVVQADPFVELHYTGLYFFPTEAKQLDQLMNWLIQSDYNEAQKKLLFLAVIQAALKKRPFHTFDGTFLQLRKKIRVKKQTWDMPILESFFQFIKKINTFIQAQKYHYPAISVTNRPACNIEPSLFEKPIDLVYLDPPFISNKKKQSLRFTNYVKNYHVPEAMANYFFKDQKTIIDVDSPKKFIKANYSATKAMVKWLDRNTWLTSLEKIVSHFQESKLVLSYRDDSYIKEESIKDILLTYKTHLIIERTPHRYTTTNKESKYQDLLFIAT